MLFVVAACGDGSPEATPTATPAATADYAIVYEASAEGATNVWAIDPASGESRALTTGDRGYSGAPAWAPDGSHIVFASDRDASPRKDDVYTMRPDGSDVRRLTSTPDVAEQHPKYSPDGTLIAYVSKREAEYRLGLMNADGTGAREITDRYRFIEFPAWRRDGSEIWFAAIGEGTQAADLLSYDMATGEVRVRVSTPASDVCPHFTRDGQALTYASRPRGGAEDAQQDIFLHQLSDADTSGANDRQITDHPARDDYANPSPDGTEFVFLSMRDGNFELYLMDADGSNQRRLTATPDIRENVPDW